MGVAKETNMVPVYERTRNLLFQGVLNAEKNPPNVHPDNPAADNNNMDIPNHELQRFRLDQRQLRLDKQGRICNSFEDPQSKLLCTPLGMEIDCHFSTSAPASFPGFGNGDHIMGKQMQIDPSGQLCKPVQGSLGQLPKSNACQSCQRSGLHNPIKCSFCDKVTCVNCSRSCLICEGMFCQFCSVINYDECFERSLCLQCNSR